MYKKVLVPLDGSREAEEVFSLIQGELAPDGQIILLKVIPPAKTQKVGSHIILGSQQEEADRLEALGYLKAVARQQGGDPNKWSCEVAISTSVAEGIANFAQRERVDLIAMYTHDRNLLARRIRGSIAREVQRRSSVEVRVWGTRELEGFTHGELGGGEKQVLDTRVLKQVDVFQDLSDEQLGKVMALGKATHVSVGEILGKRGELGEHLYVILEGEAHLSTHSEVGEISVRIARPGEAFPLAALLGSGTLITTGEALSDMEVMAIPRSELHKLFSSDADLGMKVYAAVGRLFANRYAETLTHLAIGAERELRDGGV